MVRSGMKYGVKDVVTLSTLNNAIEDVLGDLCEVGIDNLEAQSEFLAQCLDAWLEATGRKEDVSDQSRLIRRMWLTRVERLSRSWR